MTSRSSSATPLALLDARRSFLQNTAAGLGAIALSALFDREAASAEPRANAPGIPGFPHLPVKAKRVIYLFQSGAPSQIDLYDEKTKLRELSGTDLPDSIRKGQRLTGMTATQERFPLAPSIYKFARHGQSGASLSELLPHTAKIADDLCFIRTLHTTAINHDPAVTFFQTGFQLAGRPSIGSWLAYGLGSDNDDLPAFVAMISGSGGQPLYDRLWGSGFLPSKYQGVKFRSIGDPVLYLSNPQGLDNETRRRMLDDLATHAYNCLLARRMAERGVRFIQLFHRDWDHHLNLPTGITQQAKRTDQASAALVQDLKQRGLLDDTLVVWGGEFGRTAYCQGKLTATDYGRDHHPRCFTIWLAGGGIKPGITHGTTDDFSYNIVDQPVHVHDLHATLLHCLGIDHTKLTFKFQGRHYRLTDIEGEIVQPILA